MDQGNPGNTPDPQDILRLAFWSGDLPYPKWKKAMRDGAPVSIVKDSFLHLPTDWLQRQLTRPAFLRLWPEARKAFRDQPIEQDRKRLWDAVWGAVAVGDTQYPVDAAVARLGDKRRELLRLIVTHPRISIYKLARMAGRDYSRVYKDVRVLESLGHVEREPKVIGGRRRVHLVPIRSVNAVLAERSGVVFW